MSISSQPQDFSTILNDVLTSSITTIDTSSYGAASDTITLTGLVNDNSWNTGHITLTGPSSCYTYSTGASVCTTGFSNISISNIWNQQEFVDCMPEISRIEAMCKEYPGLAIAFEKFKTVYALVKDDYDTPEDQRPKP